MAKAKKSKIKRLFFDIETSYNVVSTWRVGYKINIGPENIIKERAIICICWKWQGEKKVHSLQWDKGDDKKMLIEFIKVLNEADEIIGHNSDRFDIKWIRTRCLYHRVPMMPDYQSLDTIKAAKSGFLFNSNKLDYINKFLGGKGKMETGGFKLWQEIIVDNNSKSMKKMVDYCKQDVEVLEEVFQTLNQYIKPKVHHGVAIGKDKTDCPNCGSGNIKANGLRYLASGGTRQCCLCNDCKKHFTLSKVVPKKSIIPNTNACPNCKSKNCRKQGNRVTLSGIKKRMKCNDCKRQFQIDKT